MLQYGQLLTFRIGQRARLIACLQAMEPTLLITRRGFQHDLPQGLIIEGF